MRQFSSAKLSRRAFSFHSNESEHETIFGVTNCCLKSTAISFFPEPAVELATKPQKWCTPRLCTHHLSTINGTLYILSRCCLQCEGLNTGPLLAFVSGILEKKTFSCNARHVRLTSLHASSKSETGLESLVGILDSVAHRGGRTRRNAAKPGALFSALLSAMEEDAKFRTKLCFFCVFNHLQDFPGEAFR